MTRILQSSWLTALLGCLLYLGTTFVALNPNKFAVNLAPAEDTVAEGPSWKFKNPEMDQWLAQIKDEKDSLALKEQQLTELQTRLDAERQEISTVTQAVAQLQMNFDQNVVRFQGQQTENVKHQAKLVSAMSPEGAAAVVTEMSDDDAVRLLFTMKVDTASAILDTISKRGKADAKRAAELTERLRQVLPSPTTTASTKTP